MTKKQTKRKCIAGLAALVLAVSLIPAHAASVGYSDVAVDAWYARAVTGCQEYGLMDPIADSTFDPSGLLTRGVVAEALYRLEGRPQTEGDLPFTDVPAAHANADAIRWAVQAGVVSGYPDGTFRPEAPIRREETAVLLWSCQGKATGEAQAYQDQVSISSWALPAVTWARSNKVMQGNEWNLFHPQEHTTRAQAASLLMGYGAAFYGLALPDVPNVPAVSPSSGSGLTPGVPSSPGGLAPGVSQTVRPNGYADELFVQDYRGYLSYAGGVSFRGVDVSSYQKEIDWTRVAMAGMDFAMIRAGFRGYGNGSLNKDNYFERNIRGALSNGLKVGVYFYSQAITPQEAQEEAYQLLEWIRGYDVTYPVVFDWEVPNDDDARTKDVDGATVTACARAFCQVIQNAGYIPMTYGSPKKVYDGKLMLDQLQDHPAFWLAHYTANSAPTSFRYHYDMWQYSCTGHVDGIEGNVDLDICLTDWSNWR